MSNDNTLKSWFTNNLWNILTVSVMIILGWGYLNMTVQANADAIEKLRNRVNNYPSEDFFELKFQGIDKSIGTLEVKVDNISKKIR